MASETKASERKASAPASEAATKKVKKTEADTEGAKKRKATTEIAAKPAKKSKAAASIPASKSTIAKKKPAASTTKKSTPKKPTPRKVLSATRVSPSDDESDEVNEEAATEFSEDDEEEVDDQTVALLTGFDSEEEDPEPAGEGFKAGGDVGKVDKKAKKQALAAQKKASESNEPGVVYLGRIPHGFYEKEIKSYFSQFGDITRYRVSRNPNTGRSKHYAFVEFKSSEVAEIVAKTMDNYLLFGHILKCKLLAPGQVHKDLWKGANKRFKAVPWNKIEGRKLKQGLEEAGWEKRNATEEKRRTEKAKKLKSEMDYEFEAPKLKSAKDVPKTKPEGNTAAIEDAVEEETEVKSIEAPDAGEKNEKSKASEKEETITVKTLEAEVVEEAPEVESPKGKKKAKKTEKITLKEKVVTKEAVGAGESSTAPEAEKPKRTKKSKVVEEKLEEPVAEAEVKGTRSSSRNKKSKDTEEATEEKPAPALKAKKSKETVSESSAAGKAKKVKKSKDKVDAKEVEEEKPALPSSKRLIARRSLGGP